jgi:hypothetical protein
MLKKTSIFNIINKIKNVHMFMSNLLYINTCKNADTNYIYKHYCKYTHLIILIKYDSINIKISTLY